MVAYPLPAPTTLAAPVTVTGVTAKTTLLSGPSIAAAGAGYTALAAGQIYRAEAWGVLTTAATADSFTLEWDLGAVNLMDWGAQTVASTLQANARWNATFTLEMMSATLARCWGWDGLAYFFSTQNGRESTLAGSAATFALAVTPSDASASITCEGALIQRVA